MLKGLTSDELDFPNLLAWALLHEKKLLRQKSLGSFLWQCQRSQDRQSRLLWYHICFFFASLPRISERCFFNLFNARWSFSVFFFFTNQSSFFRSLECYYANQDCLDFSSSYFRATSWKPTTLMLPYFHFFLRAPSILFLSLWYHSEQVRMRFFNDYVRSHDFLNSSQFLSRRFRFQRTVFTYRVRFSRKQFLRFLFFFHSCDNRFHALELTALNLWHQTPFVKSDFNFFPSIVNTQLLQLSLGARQLPVQSLASINQRFFLGVNYMQLNLWANALLADDPWGFGSLVRMDWAHYTVSFPLFLIRFRLRQFVDLWSNRLARQYCSLVYKQYLNDAFSYMVVCSLRNSSFFLKQTRRFHFLWWVLIFRINRYWDSLLIDQWARVGVYRNTKTKAKMFPVTYQLYHFIRLFREILISSMVIGDFYKISTFFTKAVSTLDFLFWRISSNGSTYRDFLANGAFSLSLFFQKLTLDHYAFFRFQSVRSFLEMVLRRHGFYFSQGLTWKGQQNNPWTLRKPYKRLPNGCFHPREPRWSFVRHLNTIAALKFTLIIFRRSFVLSLAAFFLIFDNTFVVKHPYAFFFQEIVKTTLAYRRYLRYYRYTPLKEFRRYPHKVYVSSRTDESFRARWFSFADRMRRAGIKKTDLPYYPIDDQRDIMADLVSRAKTTHWYQSPIYWIIDYSA